MKVFVEEEEAAAFRCPCSLVFLGRAAAVVVVVV